MGKTSNGGQKQQTEEGQIIQWVKKSNGGQKQQAEEGLHCII
jgi:hypothetical protein